MHRNNKQKVLKRTLLATALGAALLAGPLAANAAGMGKITVLSALGQPLRAELDITASREELGSLAARVAPVEAFRQANVEYASVLSSVRFTLDKHPDGKPYFKIQTDRAVNDPFIDFLVELSWSSGRLVREYAFLLDPPELKTENSVSSVTAPVTQTQADAPTADVSTSKQSNAPVQSAPIKKAPGEHVVVSKAKVQGDAPGSTTSEGSREVRRGDTLGKIAAETAAEGVSLDQMLVALYNSNKDAFDGGNMNRLRAGKILTIPSAEKATAISSNEARKVVIAQSADFNAYRNTLADAAARQKPVEQQTQQASSGKITPKVEEKAALTNGQDKLQVSRSGADVKAGAAKPSEEDVVARDKALKEANSRIADLEKNLTDLKKLAELKSQSAADAQKSAQSAKAPEAPVAALPTKQAEPAADNKAPTLPVAVPAVSPVAALEAPAVSATAAAAPAEEMPKQKPKKQFIPPPPEPEPSFIESNPLLVFGGGGAIAAVLAFLGFRTWKRKRDDKAQGITVSDLAASSVFGAASSESIDTGAASHTDFGHSTIDEIDTSKEGVDPIQEAEVYMAYGRDGQAEEILVDAMQKDPDNQAVLLKLLEIYAGRKSLQEFNTVASNLHERSAGTGPVWEKAASMGRSIDPSNPLYGGTNAPSTFTPDVTTVADQSMEATMVMEVPPAQEAPPAATVEEMPSAMDFDLDIGGSSDQVDMHADAAPASMDFDLDLGSSEPTPSESATSSGLDIDFDAPSETADAGNSVDFDIAAPVATDIGEVSTTQPDADSGLDFNFDLGDASPVDIAEQPSAPLDLSSISLELDTPAAKEETSGDSAEVATKLELALAYEEMGDREGARELLQEVLSEGSPAQQEAAKNKLAQLG